jgi:hypothetical protein
METITTKGLGDEMAKRIVNIRLRQDQEERINAIVERSAILDTSKFVRIAVDWLLRSDIGEVIKTIVADGGGVPRLRNSEENQRTNEAKANEVERFVIIRGVGAKGNGK